MPFDDKLVEVTRLLGIEPSQAEVIHDQEVGCQKPASNFLGRVVGPGLVEELEEAIGTQEEHGVACAAGRMAQRRRQEGLSHADRPHEDRVLSALEEAEAEQLLHPIAIEGDGCIPVERFEGLLFFEARTGESLVKALVVATIDLVLEQEFEELELTEFRLLRIRDPVGQCDQQTG
jgi:hypothetical protein